MTAAALPIDMALITRALSAGPLSVAGIENATDLDQRTIEAVLASMHNAGSVRPVQRTGVERWELTGDASSVQTESAGDQEEVSHGVG